MAWRPRGIIDSKRVDVLSAVTLGIRPEYVAIATANAPGALPAEVMQVQDVGTYALVTARVGAGMVRARLAPHFAHPVAGERVWLSVLGPHTRFYRNDVLITEGAQ